MKGMTFQEAEGWWSLIGDFRHLRYQFFPFFNFPYWYKTATFCVEFFQRYSQFSKSHCLLPLKYQIFFRFSLIKDQVIPLILLIQLIPVILFILFIQAKPVVVIVPVILVTQVTSVIPVSLVTSVVPVILVRNMVKFTVSSKHETLLSLYGCKKYKESLNKDKI